MIIVRQPDGRFNGSRGELTGTAFDALTKVIESADVYCLTYSRLEDTIALMQKACR